MIKNSLSNATNIYKNTGKTNNYFWGFIAFLLLAILLTVSYKLKDILKPGITSTIALDENCDLRKGKCTSDLPGGGSVSFSISPAHIPILRPLQLEVEIAGAEVSGVEVDIIGLGMEMGYNRSSLSAITKMNYTGDTILPVCVRSKMEWEARVLIQTKKGVVMVPFQFYTLKDN